MSNVVIRTADEAELSQIVKFMNEQFTRHEPIISSYQQQSNGATVEEEKEDDDDDGDEFIRGCIKNGTTFVAHSDEQLVGILIAGKIGPREHEETLELANAVNDKKFADIMKFLSYIERKADVCNHFGVPESLHLHIISVHENYYGNGIAGKLFRHCFETAQSGGYAAISVDCTNTFTARIAAKLNMKLLSTVTYEEFNEYIGSKLFGPREPHTLIRSFGFKF
jgi:ribosomal protein S18 acetylase RimI-like enzyme